MRSSNGTKNTDLRRFINSVLLPSVAHDEEVRERIERTIASHAFKSVFQPIVHIDTGQVMGVEALTRFSSDSAEPPDRWFAAAQSVGMGPALEITTMGHALKQLTNIPKPWKLTLNLGPETITHKDALTVIERSDPQRLIVELTEHIAVDDYSLLRSSLQLLRDSGVLLAIDDAGAGFSSFSHIVKLSPDIIKLDISLTRSIDTDPIKRSLAGAVAQFADDIGACIIAEGVESIGELRTLMEFGITHAQGYLFSRPQPLEELMNSGIHDPLHVQMK
jgi:EAL domain-containing protein (putative c-di-GMP-specific phosphodiesterase class I)